MESTLPILKSDGTTAGEFSLADAWLESEKGEQAVHDTVVSYLANQRRGTASAKTRSEIRGTGSKPYRQKGTGRARAGSVKSPIWQGGGVAFPPKFRSYRKKVNKKVRQLALKRAFTERIAEDAVIVVENFDIDTARTKAAKENLNAIGAGEHALLIVDKITENLRLACRNLGQVELIRADQAHTYGLLRFKKIVFNQAGLSVFVNRLESGKRNDEE